MLVKGATVSTWNVLTKQWLARWCGSLTLCKALFQMHSPSPIIFSLIFWILVTHIIYIYMICSWFVSRAYETGNFTALSTLLTVCCRSDNFTAISSISLPLYINSFSGCISKYKKFCRVIKPQNRDPTPSNVQFILGSWIRRKKWLIKAYFNQINHVCIVIIQSWRYQGYWL